MLWTCVLLLLLQTLQRSECFSCTGVVPNSDKTASDPCRGQEGDACDYTCNQGFVRVGVHACQTYTAAGTTFINQSYYGGECVRLCRPTTGFPSPRPPGKSLAAASAACAVPIRSNSTDVDGACFRTDCFDSGDAALKNVARGAFEIWQQVRNATNGMLLDHFTLGLPPNSLQNSHQGWTGGSGIQLIMQCIGVRMGWISLEAAAKNVITTLKGLVGKIHGFKIATNPHGMFPTFFDIRTGGYLGPGTSYSPMSTALMMAGVQFAVTFFEKNAALLPGPPGTVALISSLFSELWHSVDFESLPCSRAGLVDKVAGTGVPMLQDANASLCSATQYPQLDGLYEYDEEHYAVWYAYQSACSGYAAGGCPNKAIETMWSKWQGRRNKPNHAYGGHPLMTMWSGYVLQLPYYTTHPFNSDQVYTALFRESWSADWQYYNNTRHAGERGRYGLGAGPTPAWCSGGATYVADQIGQGSSYCRVYSPYILAGYLPAAPDVIASQLVDLLADGESVLQVPGTPYHVLWRKAMLDRSWTSPWITMVDFSSLLFGLSTLWVEDGFYQNFTDHAPPRPAKRSEAHLRG